MRIGIMTFHWATNYGAVLQAYALQETLNSMGHEAVLIDYYPPKFKKTLLNCLRNKRVYLIPRSIRNVKKEKKIEPFREKYLKRTAYYASSKQLRKLEMNFDCYICGSDQVWNQSFVRSSEQKKNFVYFLDFVPDDKIIASYAASFGASSYPEDLQEELKAVLLRFNAISVREQSGVEIIQRLKIDNVQLVPDPTLLLAPERYEALLEEENKGKYVFSYMLHGKQADAEELLNVLGKRQNEIRVCGNEGVEQWLKKIHDASFVVTNSFHGTVFSILFHRPFAAVLIKGSGMNDRIITLLKALGLEARIYQGDAAMLDADIDWAYVDAQLKEYTQGGNSYLENVLSLKKGEN